MGFSPAQPQEATLARYRATLRLRPGSSRYRTNGKCWLSGHRSQRTPRDRSSRKGRSKRAQPEHGHALTSRSLALRAPIVDVGAGARMAPQGCHTVNSVPPAGLRGRQGARWCADRSRFQEGCRGGRVHRQHHRGHRSGEPAPSREVSYDAGSRSRRGGNTRPPNLHCRLSITSLYERYDETIAQHCGRSPARLGR